MSTRTLIIAEIGSVHDGNFDTAKKLIEIAKTCGADIVKFQTHIAAAETTRNAPQPPYFKGEPRYEYFERTGFSLPQWKELKAHADSIGIEFMSSPFSIEAVELLEEVGVKRYKIPSGEITNLPLLAVAAKTGKQIILSSGMSSWEELDAAVNTVCAINKDIAVLQCTSEYPCPYEQVGLNLLSEMQQRYKCPVGFSDHTLTIFAPLAAVQAGATIIEKHLTITRQMYGSDAKHSLEPGEFTTMVEGIRAVELMMSHHVDKSDVSRFQSMKEIFQKSVVSVKDLKKGAVITESDVAAKKPGTGIPAAEIQNVIGRTVAHDIAADTVLQPSDLA